MGSKLSCVNTSTSNGTVRWNRENYNSVDIERYAPGENKGPKEIQPNTSDIVGRRQAQVTGLAKDGLRFQEDIDTNRESDVSQTPRKKKNQKLRQRNDGLQVRVTQLEEENQRLRVDIDTDRKKYCYHVTDLEERIRKLTAENDDLATRYSSIASAQLTHNNPNIVDLSDENRPTKIAEQFSELYDNEWTNAFTVFEKDGLQEREAISKLLEILIIAFRISQEEATEQLAALKHFGGVDNIPCTILKTLKDQRKLHFEDELGYLKQKLEEGLRNTIAPEVLLNDTIQEYILKCIRLCWVMSIQDPPVQIDTKIHVTKTRSFKKSKYRPYLKSGRYLDFVVWPALILHDGGPLLQKGTAQGTEKKFEIHTTDQEKEKHVHKPETEPVCEDGVSQSDTADVLPNETNRLMNNVTKRTEQTGLLTSTYNYNSVDTVSQTNTGGISPREPENRTRNSPLKTVVVEPQETSKPGKQSQSKKPKRRARSETGRETRDQLGHASGKRVNTDPKIKPDPVIRGTYV